MNTARHNIYFRREFDTWSGGFTVDKHKFGLRLMMARRNRGGGGGGIMKYAVVSKLHGQGTANFSICTQTFQAGA